LYSFDISTYKLLQNGGKGVERREMREGVEFKESITQEEKILLWNKEG